jgi:hypothetical protein
MNNYYSIELYIISAIDSAIENYVRILIFIKAVSLIAVERLLLLRAYATVAPLRCFARPHASHVTPQAVNRLPSLLKSWIISQSSECGVCGVRYGTNFGFSPEYLGSLLSI